MTVISPLGPRNGVGTFDCIFDQRKYKTCEEAFIADDFVKIDFVKDEEGIIYFEFSYSKTPMEKEYVRLQVQRFPFGIDLFDDRVAVDKAISILEKIEQQ